jgi:hypothetical protein
MSETHAAAVTGKSPLLKALRRLAFIADSSEPLTLMDLSRALRLPKPTCYRLACSPASLRRGPKLLAGVARKGNSRRQISLQSVK